ncbi:hypothetical protein PAXINDRAFT_20471 [Paxillus involutus ATCC 200175]|uniref:DUF6532 domain-containing protein n=1 Tax=Paxillus involutus ATCC 200175 TaxID=664439 RepID=A0A0C9TDN7_PAXIN|nr:hypothetical protein PAXINDRAFT_20471 [Paxillus involutus ATCC 200175]
MSNLSLTDTARAICAAQRQKPNIKPGLPQAPIDRPRPVDQDEACEVSASGRPARKSKTEARSVWIASQAIPSRRKRSAAETGPPEMENALPQKRQKKRKASESNNDPVAEEDVGGSAEGASMLPVSTSHQPSKKQKTTKEVIVLALKAAGVPVSAQDDQSDGEAASGSECSKASESDNESGDNDGLSEFKGNPVRLRAALAAERPRTISWLQVTKASPAQPSKPSKLVDSDAESDVEHMLMAPPPRLTSMTPGPATPCHPPASSARPSTSKMQRPQRRQAEIPVWNPPEPATTKTNAPAASSRCKSDEAPSDAKSDDKEPTLPTVIWTPDTFITLNNHGLANICEQQPHIQTMLRASISLAHQHIIFEHSYPDINQLRRSITDILYVAANQMPGCEHVHARLAQDPQYVRALAPVPSTRVSKMRCAVKVAAQRHVAGVYQLEKGQRGKEKVNALLEKNIFIFPVDSNGKPIRSKPFQSPAILRTIQDAFFEDENSAGVKFASQFISTSQEHDDELELPSAMVALAATAVRAVIMDFLSDGGVAEFNSSVFSGIYERLMELIEAIYRHSPRKFHSLFAQLYKTV